MPRGSEDEERLTDDIVALAREHGRLGYRKIAALLSSTAGWVVNDKLVERIWRQEGLKVPPRRPKRSRIWQSDGSCIRLRAEWPNHVWSYGFLEDRPIDGRTTRHKGYNVSQRCRNRIEESFGWARIIGAAARLRGLARTNGFFTLQMIAYNFVRIPRLWEKAA